MLGTTSYVHIKFVKHAFEICKVKMADLAKIIFQYSNLTNISVHCPDCFLSYNHD